MHVMSFLQPISVQIVCCDHAPPRPSLCTFFVKVQRLPRHVLFYALVNFIFFLSLSQGKNKKISRESRTLPELLGISFDVKLNGANLNAQHFTIIIKLLRYATNVIECCSNNTTSTHIQSKRCAAKRAAEAAPAAATCVHSCMERQKQQRVVHTN